MDTLPSPLASASTLLAVMGAIAVVELVIPLRARSAWGRAHLGPNLVLTLLTFAMNAALGAALGLALSRIEGAGFGILQRLAPSRAGTVGLALLGLDFSTYLAHVAMHKLPVLWRFHRVHHSDPAVDVTTTIRQHPGETLIRYAFLAASALPLGVSPAVFSAYRSLSALSGLLEHGNFRLPARLDRLLALVFTWPNLHKIHHARDAQLTDTNYGNLLSWWDRLLGTFTPSREAERVRYGLVGLDTPAAQTTGGLLGLPFRPH